MEKFDPHKEFHKERGDRWKNRRKMAWIALFGGMLFPLIALLAVDSAVMLGLSAPFYLFIGTVLSAYFGLSTWDDISCPVSREDDD